jgi:transcriptional regulator with XRE-family HTH domain
MPTKSDGQLIRSLRENKGMNGAQFAKLADIDPALLWRIENGELDGSPKTRKAIADALGVAPSTITYFQAAERRPRKQAPTKAAA